MNVLRFLRRSLGGAEAAPAAAGSGPAQVRRLRNRPLKPEPNEIVFTSPPPGPALPLPGEGPVSCQCSFCTEARR